MLEHASSTGSVRAARRAISAIFFLNGAGIGAWAVHVPAVQARAGFDTATLGLLLLTIAAGAMAAMPLAGWLSARHGSRRATLLAALLFPLAMTALVAASAPALLFVLAFCFGAANGTLDVAMNANATEVEKARGVPTMSSFHGFFSLGGLFGAALGGVLVELGLGDGTGAAALGAVIVAAVLLARPALLRVAPAPGRHGSGMGLPRGQVLALGLLALLCMAVEGALVDWSALVLKERTDASALQAALGFSLFSITMAACRFAGDALVLRFGARGVMAAGGIAIAAGVLLAVATGHYVVSALGFALVGLGAANVVPVLFTAAARTPGVAPGVGLATVATVGYSGFLLGPPLIGWIAAHAGLAVGVGSLALAGVVIAASANAVRRGAASATESGVAHEDCGVAQD
jgi:MFS family permease